MAALALFPASRRAVWRLVRNEYRRLKAAEAPLEEPRHSLQVPALYIPIAQVETKTGTRLPSQKGDLRLRVG